MHPLLKQDEFSQLQGSLNIRSSSEGREETSSAQRLYAAIKSPSCRGRAVTVPARDPPAPTARGDMLTATRCTFPHGFPSGQPQGRSTHQQNPEPSCWLTSPSQQRTQGTARAVGALLLAGRAQLWVPHLALVRADASRGHGTKAQRHCLGRRIVGAPRGVTAGGEPAAQRPAQTMEAPDPAVEGLHCRCAELLCRTGPAGPTSARATGTAAAASCATDKHRSCCRVGSAGERGFPTEQG